MALNLVPGVGEALMPIEAGVGIARGVVGEEKYQKARSGVTWTYGAVAGFMPTTPIFWPFQIGMFITFTLVLIFVFGTGVGKAILTAYVLQGIIVMFAAKWFMDKFLKYGVGL